MKRFVVCLDGTWNNTSREVERDDGSKVYRPTNVLKLARATILQDPADVSQVTYYDAGVGAMNRAPDAGARVVRWVDNTVGGGWGGAGDRPTRTPHRLWVRRIDTSGRTCQHEHKECRHPSASRHQESDSNHRSSLLQPRPSTLRFGTNDRSLA